MTRGIHKSLFKPLFDVVVEHDFYFRNDEEPYPHKRERNASDESEIAGQQNGVCDCLKFMPCDETRRVMNNAGLILSNTVSGFRISYDESKLDVLRLFASDFEGPLNFVFKAYSEDPKFKSYSDAYPSNKNGFLYFMTRLTTNHKGRIQPQQKFVSTEELEKTIEAEKQEEALKRLAKIKQLDGEENVKPEKVDIEVDEDVRELLPDLDMKDRISSPVFVIRISGLNKDASMLKNWPAAMPTIYLISLSSRKRYWKYYLFGNYAKQAALNSELNIFDSSDQIKFKPLRQEVLGNQSVAYTYVSDQPIQLRKVYKHKFQLKPGRDAAALIARLPVANNNQVGYETIENQEMIVSEIYINS